MIEIDLPDGNSAEILLRPEDDPHAVVADFVRHHDLAPHTAEKLREYVFAELSFGATTSVFENKEHDQQGSTLLGDSEKKSNNKKGKPESKLRQRLNNLRDQRQSGSVTST